MGFLFLDIESFVDPEDEESGLNPFHKKSKIIAIAYNHYSLAKAPHEEQIKPPTFLFEWEVGSEKKMLEEFYKLLVEWSKKDDVLKIIGFNHMAYDLPFLFSRMEHHDIGTKKELFDLLFTKPRHVDLAQIGMAVARATKYNEDFRCISQKAINAIYEIPVKEDNGKIITTYYIEKKYDKIKKYCTEEFTFELLYQSLLQTFLH
jgi:DNA polymerase elongation subunit (family B)